MVAGLRQRLLAAGGSLAAIAEVAVLPNIRNSEAHESLAWDGFSEHYVAEEGQVPYNVVVTALQVTSSFVQGAEAGLAAIRALHAVDDVTELPAADDEGRMPSADRIRGFFGTNLLILMEARLNSPHARFRVQRLGMVDINPCFQALLLSRRLLPRTQTFEVTAVDTAGSLHTVDADALDATMPGWEYAVSHLDQMPLATFLPANYSARTKSESAAEAIRAVAWIAADDAVGVIDGSLEAWSAEVRRLLAVRLQVIAIALEHTRGMISMASPSLDSVHESVVQLRRWIETDHPGDPWVADDQPALQKLRSHWEVWGPVPRLPTVTQEPAPVEVSQALPRLRVVHRRDCQAF